MCDPEAHIPIEHIDPVNSDGDDLKGCYFRWTGENNNLNTYNFFDMRDDLIVPGLSVGQQSFDFVLPYVANKVWALNLMAGSCTFVAGNFVSRPTGLPLPDVITEPDGSYQAQAGGTVGDDTDAVAAAAKA